MPNRFEARYSQEQRDSLARAYEDLGVRPANAVVQMAKMGKLPNAGGELLPAFDTNVNTVRHYVDRLRKRRAGIATTALASKPHRDAIDLLRRELIGTAEEELAHERAKPKGKRDLDRLRQITRCIREAAPLSDLKNPPPVKPGHRNSEGGRDNGTTRSGIAADILADVRKSEAEKGAQTVETPMHEGEEGEGQAAALDANSEATQSGDNTRETTHAGEDKRTDVSTVALGEIAARS